MTIFKELVDHPSGVYVESVSASGIHQLREASANDVPGIPFTMEELDTALSNGSVNQLLIAQGGVLRSLGLIEHRELTIGEVVFAGMLSSHW